MRPWEFVFGANFAVVPSDDGVCGGRGFGDLASTLRRHSGILSDESGEDSDDEMNRVVTAGSQPTRWNPFAGRFSPAQPATVGMRTIWPSCPLSWNACCSLSLMQERM